MSKFSITFLTHTGALKDAEERREFNSAPQFFSIAQYQFIEYNGVVYQKQERDGEYHVTYMSIHPYKLILPDGEMK